MNAKYKDYVTLAILIILFVVIGKIIGMLTVDDMKTWYNTLQRSPLTPPNYVFGIAWTLLYSIIALVGWLIWRCKDLKDTSLLKLLYSIHLFLNWSWTIIFFKYHQISLSLMSLILLVILVTSIIVKSYRLKPLISLLFAPYLGWLLFATYLNFYIWYYN